MRTVVHPGPTGATGPTGPTGATIADVPMAPDTLPAETSATIVAAIDRHEPGRDK